MELHFDSDLILNKFKPLLNNNKRYLVLYGGAGSGKSIFCAQKIILRMIAEKNHRFLLIRKVARTIRRSMFQVIIDLIHQYQLEKFFTIHKTNFEITCKLNKNQIICNGIDDVEKLKSIQGITGVWIEEATEITKEDFMQIDLRLRGFTDNYKQILLSFNPIENTHWIKEMFFDKKNERVEINHSTYLDNPFLDESYKTLLKELVYTDQEYSEIYAKGNWGKIGNLIFPKYDMADEPDVFDDEIIGVDFGFNNPCGCVEIKIKDKVYYVREILYKAGLTDSDIIEELNGKIENKNANVYADPENAGAVEQLKRNDFNCQDVKKDVKAGLDLLKSLFKAGRIKINAESVNLIKELNNYKYKAKNDYVIDEPIKYLDHLIDAMRYAIYNYEINSADTFSITKYIKRKK